MHVDGQTYTYPALCLGASAPRQKWGAGHYALLVIKDNLSPFLITGRAYSAQGVTQHPIFNSVCVCVCVWGGGGGGGGVLCYMSLLHEQMQSRAICHCHHITSVRCTGRILTQVRHQLIAYLIPESTPVPHSLVYSAGRSSWSTPNTHRPRCHCQLALEPLV